MHQFVRVVLFVCSFSYAHSQIFSDQTEAYGISSFCNGIFGNGISAYDWNNDGWDDLVLLQDGSIPLFYENNHHGFTQIFFDGITENQDIKSVNWVDFDNDGLLDLSINSNVNGMSLYHRVGPNEFMDITALAGITKHPGYEQGFGQAWGDYDKDGDLDFFHCNYNNLPDNGIEITNRLYRNDGNLSFRDVTTFAGLHLALETSFLPVWTDYNNDSWPDLFIANDKDYNQNFLYRNDGDGSFTDVSVETGANILIDAMSGTFGDYDNDGFFDVYITNLFPGNVLHRNNQGVSFQDVSAINNVQFFQWCWASSWIDYDCDGWQDLFVSCSPAWQFALDGNHFILQNLQQTFELQFNSGFGVGSSETFAAARGDFNNDGYPDLITHSELPQGTQIWINNATNAGNWLKVRPQAVISNPMATGVLIQAHTGDLVQSRYTLNGEQYLSQNSQWEFFGFGQTDIIDSIVVTWPSGQRDALYNINVNQALVITEGLPTPPQLNITYGSTSFCEGDSVVFDAGEHESYFWHNGHTGRYFTAYNSDSVYAEVFDGVNSVFLSGILITMHSNPVTDAIVSEPVCYGSSEGFIELMLQTEAADASIDWAHGATDFALYGLSAGYYQAQLTFGPGCTADYEFELSQFDPFTIDSILIFPANNPLGCPSGWSSAVMYSGGGSEITKSWTVSLPISGEIILEESGDTLECLPDMPSLFIRCRIEDDFNCSNTRVTEFNQSLSIASNLNVQDVKFYPNPAAGFLFYESAQQPEPLSIRIYDLTGRMLYETQTSSAAGRINFPELANGVYRICFVNELNVYSFNFVNAK